MTSLTKPARGTALLERRARRAHVVKTERQIMQTVRREDRLCRVPWCNGKVNHIVMPLDVCHARHRGIGGNPALDRTSPEALILLCRRCHGEYDRGALTITPIDEAHGLRGLCEFRQLDENLRGHN